MSSEHDSPRSTTSDENYRHGYPSDENPGDYWSRTRQRASARDASFTSAAGAPAQNQQWVGVPVPPHTEPGQGDPRFLEDPAPPPPPGHRHALSMVALYVVGAMLLIWTAGCVAVTLDDIQDGDSDLVIGLGMTAASAIASAVVGSMIIRGHRKRAWYRRHLEDRYYRRHG